MCGHHQPQWPALRGKERAGSNSEERNHYEARNRLATGPQGIILFMKRKNKTKLNDKEMQMEGSSLSDKKKTMRRFRNQVLSPKRSRSRREHPAPGSATSCTSRTFSLGGRFQNRT